MDRPTRPRRRTTQSRKGVTPAQTRPAVNVAKPAVQDIPTLPKDTRFKGWFIWRGSPELLAHTIRVAQRATGGATGTVIDVAVQDDHELFFSPKEFVDNVTLDALRHFKSIEISVNGPNMSVWMLLEWKGTYARWGSVIVACDGVDSAADEEAVTRIHNAVKRGGTEHLRRQEWFRMGVQFGFSVLGLVAYSAVGVLLTNGPLSTIKMPSPWGDVLVIVSSIAFGAGAVVGGILLGRWAYPSLEVAERGETRLRRSARWLGGLTATLVVAVVLQVMLGD